MKWKTISGGSVYFVKNTLQNGVLRKDISMVPEKYVHRAWLVNKWTNKIFWRIECGCEGEAGWDQCVGI